MSGEQSHGFSREQGSQGEAGQRVTNGAPLVHWGNGALGVACGRPGVVEVTDEAPGLVTCLKCAEWLERRALRRRWDETREQYARRQLAHRLAGAGAGSKGVAVVDLGLLLGGCVSVVSLGLIAGWALGRPDAADIAWSAGLAAAAAFFTIVAALWPPRRKRL